MAFAQNDPSDMMEELMEEIIGEIRDEINQEIKSEVRQDTTETVAEETLSPSNTFSGVYRGPLEEGGTATCNLTITQTGFSGTCFGGNSDVIVTSTGGNLATFFIFAYNFNDKDISTICDGFGTATLLSGNGEPGTTIKVILKEEPPCVEPGDEVIFFVKQ